MLFIFNEHLNFIFIALLSCTILIIVHFIKLFWRKWNFFKKRNVRSYRGLPIIGSFYKMFNGTEAFGTLLKQFYEQFPDEQFFGIFEVFMHPIYVIRDPELIKRITSTDFDYFINHHGNFDYESYSMISRTLFNNKNEHWKNMRAILTPAFTGNKMRSMFELVQNSSLQFIHAIDTENDKIWNENVFECKDLFSRFACNIIATCSFGLNIDTITNRDDEFFLAGKHVTELNGWQGIKFLLFDSVPQLMKCFKVKYFDPKIVNYFRNVVNSTVEYREQNNVIRPDMIQLLMEAKQVAINARNDSKIG